MNGLPPQEDTALLGSTHEEDECDVSLEKEYHEHNMALPKAPILISLWLGSFLVAFDGTVVANVMNRIAEEFQESDKKQWIATSFLLTNTAFQPLYGKLSDVATGRKLAILITQFFFCLGLIISCFAQNVTQFAIGRAVCGIGGGGISAMGSIVASDICTAKERGMYQGYANIVFGAGQLLGAPLGGVLITTVGWRAIFAAQIPLSLLCIFMAGRNVNIKLAHLPPRKERLTMKNLSRLDLVGSCTLVLSISGLLFLFSTSINKTWISAFTIVTFAIFIYNERYLAKERIIPFDLLRGTSGITSLVTVLSSFLMFGDVFRSPIYLQIVQNVSLAKSGVFILFGSVACAATSVLTGWIIQRTSMDAVKCTYLIVLAMVFLQLVGTATNAILIANLNPDETTYADKDIAIQAALSSKGFMWKVVYVFSTVLNSFGYGGVLVAVLVSIVFTVPKSQQATLTGVFYLWRSIGNVLGTSVTLALYDLILKFKLKIFMESRGLSKSYPKLVRDSGYLRSHFSGKTLSDLLGVYNNSFLWSFGPCVVFGFVAVILAYMLVQKYRPVK
ncbi:LAQU0S01e11320g1_1 [Lachancea quebecensis]|uniref:LAQU0S01e11320g1_1 n=1 Tax=Lachancea quebecensis TaxID=1654605 RepID=A0A0P1KVG8_9SACH|nr:LAQU0S01e11320g1_1 [Lachancea quebecensis]